MKKFILFTLLFVLISWCGKQRDLNKENKNVKPVIEEIAPSWDITPRLQERIKANSVPGF